MRGDDYTGSECSSHEFLSTFQQLSNNMRVTWTWSAALARGLAGPGSPLAGRMFAAEQWAVPGAEPMSATGVICSLRQGSGREL